MPKSKKSRKERFEEDELDNDFSEQQLPSIKIKEIKWRNANQEKCYNEINEKDLTFVSGCSGTGKTLMAVYAALQDYQSGKVDKIIITRPTVLAADDLGFAPGSVLEKLEQHLIPLYESFIFFLGEQQFDKMLDAKRIVPFSIAHMRGFSAHKTFVICDEGQNMTPKQSKMLMTRIGDGSKMVITLDPEQCDLPDHIDSLADILDIFDDESIGFCEFDEKDVVRSKMCRTVLKCFKKIEKKSERFQPPIKQNGEPKTYNTNKY